GLVALAVFSPNLMNYLATIPLSPGTRAMLIAQQSKLVGITIPNGLSSAAHAAVQGAINESFIASFRVIMLVAAGMALASALISFLLIEGKKPAIVSKEAPSSYVPERTDVSIEGEQVG